MTNLEKFKKIFKGDPQMDVCPIYCSGSDEYCPYWTGHRCLNGAWWDEEYKAESEE